ncbi:MAG TPA: hypothetical protein VFY73_13590 [Ideonella sp.]|uniref:hypothetical protein n=1 Tax=Ideonella sp. TaxID=1929293 RepID=UPI002E376572|nr:hypothetical protein [Ideonella sp.]HEX5685050.1 hypothetical protein [Ideonella sp.]
MKKPLRRIAMGAIQCFVGTLCLVAGAQAVQEGKTAQGYAYVSGGVSQAEQAYLHARRESFSLWAVTAAKKTGAYLVDVRVKITDAQLRVVFDAPLDGPWLLIDLPLGRYDIQASLGGETQRTVTTIHPGDHHQAFFYFPADAEVSPERDQPTPGSPYGGKKP